MTLSQLAQRLLLAILALGAAHHAGAQGYTHGGVTGAYFANSTLSGPPSFTRNDVRIRFAWNGSAPGGSTTPAFAAVPASGFSARWTGTIVAPSSGLFTFSAITSGPARLWLTPVGGAKTQVFRYAGSGLATTRGRFTLTAGQTYAVRFEFQDTASPAVAELDWAAPGMAPAPIEPAAPLGVNMTSNADWDGSRLFADAMKQSRGWCTPDSCASPVPSDAQGWPTADFLVIPVAGPPRLNGTYALRFQGLAQVDIMFGYGGFSVGATSYGAVLPSGAGYDPATNTTTATLTITPTEGINVFVNFTATQRAPGSATNTGVTGLQLMRPTAPGATKPYGFGQLFTGALETDVAPFTTIRYMGYLNTNGSTIAHWADRVLPSLPIQANFNGGALEYAVMLANETGKDLWINVPVSADDDYVQRLAQLLRYGSDGVNPYTSLQANPVFPPIDPNLDVYVEYSNEVWNFSFSQAETNLQLAEAEVANGASPLNFDGSTNIWYWGWRRVAERIAQISNIFRGVWGDAAMGQAIRPVLEWQVGNGQDTADQQLTLLSDYYDNADGLTHVATPHPPSYYLWGAGGGWYHSVNNPAAATIGAIYKSGLAPPTAVPVDSAWAHSFGLTEAGYEGGFEIGGDQPSTLQLAANLDSRAKGFELSGLDYFFAEGGGLGLVFNVAGASAYGLADPTIYDSSTPKLKAVAALTAGAPPAVALGNPVSGTVSLPTTAADIAHYLWGNWGTTVYVGAGTWLNWTVNVSQPGSYVISTNLGAASGQSISVDGIAIGNSGAAATLTAGLHGIHVRNLASSGSLALTTLTLSRQ
jgi:hypothetical protein